MEFNLNNQCSILKFLLKVLVGHRMAILVLPLILLFTPITGPLNLNAQNGKQLYHSMTVKEALEQLKVRTGYSIWFNVQDVNLNKKVTVDFKNEDVRVLLNEILEGQPLTYGIKDKVIQIRRKDANVRTERKGRL